ncbi:MAG: hypothetical protein LWX02_00595 [Deltaproteobacteria bacterium]|nr:hypothetical protein [Deltaproteobacteria bacterium]MDL1986329.1 hypothetical protein [Deltaproteobacteria bacterium]
METFTVLKELTENPHYKEQRFKHKDRAILDYKEALNMEKIRNKFFVQLKELLRKQQD